MNSGTVGDRRAAIFAAAEMFQEDLLLWQQRGSKAHVRSSRAHYADEHLNQPRLSN